jgi:hypothetical protein
MKNRVLQILSQLFPYFRAQALCMSSSKWLVLSVWSSAYGWYTELKLSMVSINSWYFSQYLDVNCYPLSDTIFLGTPYRHTIRDTYNSVSLALEYVILTGMKWAIWASLSMMTHMESYPAWVWGNPTMKFILISSHFHSEIFNGSNRPASLWCSGLTCQHVSHNYMYSAISRFMPYHQYLVFRSLYSLVLSGWIKYANSWPF